MNVVIVAGGLGSRLAPLTNYIPKFLVNIGKNTGYVEQVRYWKNLNNVFHEDGSTLTVIVHSAYKKLIEAYHKLYFPEIELIVKTVDVHNGSAHAILSTCDHLVGKEVFFQWCDVMPAQPIPAEEMAELYVGSNVVFTNYDFPNRYGLEGHWADLKPVQNPSSNGGIFGLYYINEFKTQGITFTQGQDFVEVIEQFGKIREHRVSKIIDWGDVVKLDQTRDGADKAREFNSITFEGNLVLKQATNAQGRALIKKEIAWYHELAKNGCSLLAVPKVWAAQDEQSFIMERVYGLPAYEKWRNIDEQAEALVLSRVLDEFSELHWKETDVPKDTVMRDVKKEAFTKIKQRCAEIKDVIDSFGEIHTVNGHMLSTTPDMIIDKLYEQIESYYDSQSDVKYSLIHGDWQLSNTILMDDWHVKIIDPRGYFGETMLYGLADYDYGKLLYSLSGYDLFNYSRLTSIEELKNGEIKFSIPKLTLGADLVPQAFKDKFKKIHFMWMAVNWIGLAQYIKNDPVKSVCSYYHGLYLADRLLNES